MKTTSHQLTVTRFEFDTLAEATDFRARYFSEGKPIHARGLVIVWVMNDILEVWMSATQLAFLNEQLAADQAKNSEIV
jgi:hypothetical protein